MNRVQDGGLQSLQIFELLVRFFLFRCIPERFNRADGFAVNPDQRCRCEEKPSSRFSHVGKEVFSLVCSFDQARWTGSSVKERFYRLAVGSIDDKVRHTGLLFLIKRLPMVFRSDDDLSTISGHCFDRLIPVRHHMVFVDDKRGESISFDNLRYGPVTPDQISLHGLKMAGPFADNTRKIL